jgi:hypothetical protein
VTIRLALWLNHSFGQTGTAERVPAPLAGLSYAEAREKASALGIESPHAVSFFAMRQFWKYIEAYIEDFYSTQRPHSGLGHRAQIDFEEID